MINNSSVSRCLKSDFSAFEKVEENIFIIRWGKKDEVERVYEIDEETGEPVFTGEVKETDWCTYESGTYTGELSKDVLSRYFNKSQRYPNMSDLQTFSELMSLEERETVAWMRDFLMKAVLKHDKSKEVESFTIGNVSLWLDYEMRGKVRENLESCQQEGLTETTLRINGMEFPMTVELGWQMYYALLKYARETWNVTEIHKAAVTQLSTIQDLIDYESYYPTAYPEKLNF